MKTGRRDTFGINPMEGESEPDEMEENVMANTAATSTFFPGGQTSAVATATSYPVQGPSSRRAPVMGNRGLESQRIHHQERSRSKSKSSSGGGGGGGGGSHAKDSSRSRGSPRTSRKSGDSQVVSLIDFTSFFFWPGLFKIFWPTVHRNCLSNVVMFLMPATNFT